MLQYSDKFVNKTYVVYSACSWQISVSFASFITVRRKTKATCVLLLRESHFLPYSLALLPLLKANHEQENENASQHPWLGKDFPIEIVTHEILIKAGIETEITRKSNRYTFLKYNFPKWNGLQKDTTILKIILWKNIWYIQNDVKKNGK